MKQQRGGTFLGFILGLVVGLGVALVVAIYVTKMPVPFVDRGVTRSSNQDVMETQKNKDWDPNSALYGKNPARPVPSAGAPAPRVASSEAGDAKAVLPKSPASAAAALAALAASKAQYKAPVSADPLGDLAQAKATAAKPGASTGDAVDAFTYFVQAGAFRTIEDAESQRAKLLLAGIETRISEREQSGQIMHRVRVGPYGAREDADRAKAKLEAAGFDAALVRVQR